MSQNDLNKIVVQLHPIDNVLVALYDLEKAKEGFGIFIASHYKSADIE